MKTSDEAFICIEHPDSPCVMNVNIGKYICLACFIEQLKEEND